MKRTFDIVISLFIFLTPLKIFSSTNFHNQKSFNDTSNQPLCHHGESEFVEVDPAPVTVHLCCNFKETCN